MNLNLIPSLLHNVMHTQYTIHVYNSLNYLRSDGVYINVYFLFSPILDVFQMRLCETLDKFECRISQKCTLTMATACKMKNIKIHTRRENWILFLIVRFHAAHRFIWLFILNYSQ